MLMVKGFVVVVVGFYIYRTANWQKHAVLTNPRHRSVAGMYTTIVLSISVLLCSQKYNNDFILNMCV
jgi:hypothetical protein